MSVQSFDHACDYYTATFTIEFSNGKRAKVSYGVWTAEKNPKSYIKTTLNYQRKLDDYIATSNATPNKYGYYGQNKGYPRPINDASGWLSWNGDKGRYVEAEVERISIGNPVADTKVEYLA